MEPTKHPQKVTSASKELDPVPPSPVTPEDELDVDFSDEVKKPKEEQEVAAASDEHPTVGQQAEFLLQAPEADGLSQRDKEFLSLVARDMQEAIGILHRNPDGTYAPINDPTGGDRIVDSSSGEIKAMPGYRFREDTTEYSFKDAPDVVYTNENLTDEVAKRILKHDKIWSRSNIRRGYYEEKDNYWKKA